MALSISGSANHRFSMSVIVAPGHSALMRIARPAYSIAAERVSPMTACLLAQYAERPAAPESPPTDAVLTIAPPPARRIAGISYFIDRNTPLRLTPITASQSSSG